MLNSIVDIIDFLASIVELIHALVESCGELLEGCQGELLVASTQLGLSLCLSFDLYLRLCLCYEFNLIVERTSRIGLGLLCLGG